MFSWAPTNNHAGAHTVTITVSDGVLTDTETIAITVTAVNDAPVLTAIGNKEVNENATLTLTASATDEDNATLTFALDGISTGKGMTLSSAGAFSWTPANIHAGTHEVTITVSDGVLTDSETITITVNTVNHAPVLASIGNRQVNEDATLIFTASATDQDDATLTFTLDATASGKGMTLSSTGAFSWTPTKSNVGPHQATITVSDGVLTDSETITITVNAVNHAPVLAAIGNKEVNEDLTLTLTASATDEDNETLAFDLDATSSTKGMTINPAGGFSWTPTQAQLGNHSVTITLSDGKLTDSETFTITVHAVNDAPVVSVSGGLNLSKGAKATITSAVLLVTDPDNTTAEIMFTVTALPVNGTLLRNETALALNNTFSQADVNQNRISYQHNGLNGDTDKFSFSVSDGQGGAISATDFSISIDITTAIETGLDADVSIYPVPAWKEVNMKMTNTYRGRVNFHLVDITGKEMMIEDVTKENTELIHSIDLSNIPSGILFLQITTAKYTRTLKLLKK